LPFSNILLVEDEIKVCIFLKGSFQQAPWHFHFEKIPYQNGRIIPGSIANLENGTTPNHCLCFIPALITTISRYRHTVWDMIANFNPDKIHFENGPAQKPYHE
jgi:hypothetical protein